MHSKINLCDKVFLFFYFFYFLCVQHIIHVMHKGVHWSQESRRPDSVWVEWVPNTFSFRNLAFEFTVFGLVDLDFIFVFIFG